MSDSLDRLINIFRNNAELAIRVKHLIYKYVDKLRREGYSKIKIMNFCGTHEWTTVHYGIRSLLPDEVELVAGPGCPVCITPSKYIEEVIRLAFEGVKVYVFGDAYKLPSVHKVGRASCLADAKSMGADIEVVYSFLDAIEDFKVKKGEALFVGIGFETTAPSYAMPIYTGLVPDGLYLLSILRLTPPAADYALSAAIEKGLEPVSAIVAPGHVSTIIGAEPWDRVSRKFGIPTVVSGFEPADLLISVAMLLKMIYEKRIGVEIEYRRIVNYNGNTEALKYMYNVFLKDEAAWRGIGFIPNSGLRLKEEYNRYDAVGRFGVEEPTKETWVDDLHPQCKCAEVVLGLKKPTDCLLFMKACTPERPMGPCMVSLEGTCSVWARFGGGGRADEIAKSLGLGE